MFEPDIILPEQFLAFLGNKPLQGERLLLLAILEDAIHCFQMYLLAKKPYERRLFQEAEKWLSSSDPQWFFSFDNICSVLNIHPDRLREGLKRWKAEQLSRQEKSKFAAINPSLKKKLVSP